MTPRSSDSPLRIGVIGLGRHGLYCLERWSDRSAVTVAAACDPDPRARSIAAALCERVEADAERLLAADDLDAVLLAVPVDRRAALGIQVLAAGMPLVIAEPPVATTLDEATTLFDAAEKAGRPLLVWSPDRDELGFRAALEAARLQPCGALRFLRYERWNAARLPGFDAERPGITALGHSIVAIFDQLIALSGAAPRTVATSRAAHGLTAVVEFVGDTTAGVTLGLGMSVNLDSGWAFEATQGGFAANRRWVRTADDEVYEVPIEPPASPTLEETLRSVLSGEAPPVLRVESLRLVATLDAVARSLRTGQKTDVATV